ncbi:hypothetical protein N7475_003546 [Penicillium sp. IBT 31633x]|nr:hypothetical protein N7475_003546 [Penicillium sp. IBT 31633x]
MGGKRKKGSSTWADPNFDHVELEPRAHAKKLLKITQQWKATADEGGIPPHDRFVEFLDAVTSLTTKMRDSEMLQELGRIRALLTEHDRKQSDMISKMQHTIEVQAAKTTATTKSVNTLPTPRPTSYRDALASHVTRQTSTVSGWMSRTQTNGTSIPSNDLSSSSSAPAPMMMREHLQLTVRGTDRAIVDPLRRREDELVKRLNRSINDVARELDNTEPSIRLLDRVVSAARVLPSGDVLIQTDDIKEYEDLIKAAPAGSYDTWCQVLGENAGLKRPTYTVVAHGVTCRFSPSAQDARKQLKAENVRRISTAAEIVYMDWLMTKRKMDETRPESAKLLIEFADPHAANQAILRDLAIYGRNHDCQLFDGSDRLQQCYRCQMYGHIARNCKRDIHCAYCAGDHDSKECPHAHDRRKAKCAECAKHKRPNFSHFAFDRGCPIRGEELAKIQLNRRLGPQLHPELHSEPGTSPPREEDHPTPSETAQADARAAEARAAKAAKKKSSSRSRSRMKKRRVVESGEESQEEIEEDLRALSGSGAQPVDSVNDVVVIESPRETGHLEGPLQIELRHRERSESFDEPQDGTDEEAPPARSTRQQTRKALLERPTKC